MEEPRVIVGVDFGTTFSGFAYAHKADPNGIFTFYDWPMQAKGRGKPYCKTQTSLYYVPKEDQPEELVLQDWAWPAQLRYLEDLQASGKARTRTSDGEAPSVAYLAQRFKLHLASEASQTATTSGREKAVGSSSATVPPSLLHPREKLVALLTKLGYNNSSNRDAALEQGSTKPPSKKKNSQPENNNDLPPGVTVERAISDYLRQMSDFIMDHLQKTFGKHLSKSTVQWCLTVPAIWDDAAKQQMRQCAQLAGMVSGPLCPPDLRATASPHALIVVLESEAAAVHCARKFKQLNRLHRGSKQFLVADVGGGTADIVVHVLEDTGEEDAASAMPRLRLREVKQSVGGLCGSTFVDRNFLNFIHGKLGPCFLQFLKETPLAATSFLRKWEDMKCTFDGSSSPSVIDVPRKLATLWQRQNQTLNRHHPSYDELELTCRDMADIFDPVVDQILGLIRHQLSPEVQAIMLVGGFSASPYLTKRVKETFADSVEEILCPPDPGSAICRGAVVLGLAPDTVTSRVSRKTYGINEYRPFVDGTDPAELREVVDGEPKCRDAFCSFLSRGEHVGVDDCVRKRRYPVFPDQQTVTLNVYSSPDPSPRYISDPGVKLEASYVIDISDDPGQLGTSRCICISLYFGKSYIQVKAQRDNFGNTSEVLEMTQNIDFSWEPTTTNSSMF